LVAVHVVAASMAFGCRGELCSEVSVAGCGGDCGPQGSEVSVAGGGGDGGPQGSEISVAGGGGDGGPQGSEVSVAGGGGDGGPQGSEISVAGGGGDGGPQGSETPVSGTDGWLGFEGREESTEDRQVVSPGFEASAAWLLSAGGDSEWSGSETFTSYSWRCTASMTTVPLDINASQELA
ncbi:hypothetical protein Vretifemale_13620, partial [Volvox reticuliferus]